MRILQLIDSLEPGGAERMAVNLSNALTEAGYESHLIATRQGGDLEDEILPDVQFTVLKKKSAWDLMAVNKLARYIKRHDINVIHAHSSSFFSAYLVKFLMRNVRLVWHDHYGMSEQLDKRPTMVLRFCSSKFDSIISVNDQLRNWAQSNLKCKRVIQLDNFVWTNTQKKPTLELKFPQTFRIICLANFRPQKDHLNLVKAFANLSQSEQAVSLHLIGKLWGDQYEDSIRDFIAEKELKVHIYGPQKNVHGILKQADLGVLSSLSEGLPLALLEYGMAGLAVIATDVGQCREVVGDFGSLVPPADHRTLADAMIKVKGKLDKGEQLGKGYCGHITKNYAFDSIYSQLKSIYHGKGAKI
ncbi:glycosyltransferase [Aureitalea marina]|uniref:Glycosyltransferase n=1 Tax=Aureitalea marina TaxID=930804 RepID=A0A2S7KMN3_9FLAO|nr:glycosyltransferase [Aureitalea marina]PQB03894.1 hypothetical protein BST85_02460 [Aureitalea marina]